MVRDVLFVREKVEAAIRRGDESAAKLAAVSVVDEWAASVIVAHLGTTRFPLQVVGELTAAEKTPFFGTLGIARDQPEEVSKWVFECNMLMKDRLRYWAEQSIRFRGHAGSTAKSNIR